MDLLSEMASTGAAAVNVSVTTLHEKLQRVMEPCTSTPKKRLEALEKLAEAGVPVRSQLSCSTRPYCSHTRDGW